jgi:hypothetical protein
MKLSLDAGARKTRFPLLDSYLLAIGLWQVSQPVEYYFLIGNVNHNSIEGQTAGGPKR